ncbi:MAG TPA: DUF924 family protein [Polyangiaceae bacterium]|nr:DUF924 family protein [Polyangiaceae bacterium]
MTTPEEILQFWFGEPARDANDVMDKLRRWFRGGAEIDADVRERFGAAVEAALAGELDGWALEARSRLALVLLLDQFTRNVYRGDPRTHAGDEKAQELALDAFDRGLDRTLSYVERVFLSMPLIHSEHLSRQRRVDEIVAQMTPEAPPECGQMAAMHAEQTAKYTAIIARFGRFPHRNELLGRISTPEEEEFLKDWEQKGPPRGGP